MITVNNLRMETSEVWIFCAWFANFGIVSDPRVNLQTEGTQWSELTRIYEITRVKYGSTLFA